MGDYELWLLMDQDKQKIPNDEIKPLNFNR